MKNKQISFFSMNKRENDPFYMLLDALQETPPLPDAIKRHAKHCVAYLSKVSSSQDLIPVELLQKLAVISGTVVSNQPNQNEVLSAFHYYLKTLIAVIEFQISHVDPDNIDHPIAALTQIITLGEIQELSTDHFNQISIQIFDKPLVDVGESTPLEPLHTLLKNLEDTRLQKIETGLTQLLLVCLNHDDPDAISKGVQNLPLCMSASSDQARQIIDVFYLAFFPLNASVDYETKWVHVVSALSNRSVSPSVLDVLLPKSYPEDFIKTTFERLNAPKELKESLLALKVLIQKKMRSAVGKNQNRWKHSNNRIMEIVDIVYKSSTSTPLSKAIAERVTDACRSQIKDWEGTCSVGVEMAALDFRQKIESILADNGTTANLETNHYALIPAIQIKLQKCLQSILIDYSSDVHHINLLMLWIYQQLGEQAVPDALKDPYSVAFRDKMYEKKDWLLQKFNESDWLFEAIVNQLQIKKQPTVSIQTVFDEWGQLFVQKPNSLMDGEIYGRLLESTMRSFPHLFLHHTVSMEGIHTQLGGHGLLGLSARAGNFDVFVVARESISKLKILPFDFIDPMGYRLWDYGVRGGNPKILNLMIDENMVAFVDVLNNAPNGLNPNVLALAAESRSVRMLHSIIERCSLEQLNRMLVGRDQREFTPLMHAAAAGDPEIIEKILLLLEAQNVEFLRTNLELRNKDGETALILASSFAKSPQAIRVLLHYGANPNARVMGLDGKNGYSPIEIAMNESLPEIVKTLCGCQDIEINLLELFRLTTHEECVQLCAQKAYELGVDVVELLHKPAAKNCRFAHWLAKHNPAGLESIIKRGVLDDVLEILKITDASGNSVAHWLAKYNGAVLEPIITSRGLADGLQILKLRDVEGNSVAHRLAHHGGDVFESLIKSEVLRCNALEILKLPNSIGNTVVRWFVNNNAARLESLITSDALWGNAMEILKLRDNDGNPLAHFLANYHAAVLESLIKNDALHGDTMAILRLRDAEGNSPAHLLAKYRAAVLESLIKSDMSQSDTMEILKLRGAQGLSVAHFLAHHNGAVLESLIKSDMSQGDTIEILKLRGGKGLSVAHLLAHHNGAVFESLIKSDALQGEAMEMLKLRDAEGSSVAHLLAVHHATVLKSLIKSDRLHLSALEILKITHINNPYSVAHCLINLNKNVFIDLVESDGLRDQITEILKIGDSNQVSIAHSILKSEIDFLEYLLCEVPRNHTFEILKMLNRDGKSIAYYLNLFRRLRVFNLLLRSEGLKGYGLAVLKLADLFRPDSQSLLQMLYLTTPDRVSIAHRAAMDCDPLLDELLEISILNQAILILKIAGPDNTSVAHLMAQYNQHGIDSGVLDLLSLNDPHNYSMSYWADTKYSSGFFKVLRRLSPEQAFDILTLQDSQRVTVAHRLAQYNPKFFLQLLNTDHLRPEAKRILNLQTTQGVSVEQLFSEAIACERVTQCNATCTVS